MSRASITDLGNAAYWYRRAKTPVPEDSVAAEHERLLDRFLDESHLGSAGGPD